MEQSMELVSRKCGQQLNDFQRCILANRQNADGGEGACQDQRMHLSTCAADAVPLVALVKQRCQSQLHAYHSAVKFANEGGRQGREDRFATERLTVALKDLYACTEAVRGEETSKTTA